MCFYCELNLIQPSIKSIKFPINHLIQLNNIFFMPTIIYLKLRKIIRSYFLFIMYSSSIYIKIEIKLFIITSHLFIYITDWIQLSWIWFSFCQTSPTQPNQCGFPRVMLTYFTQESFVSSTSNNPNWFFLEQIESSNHWIKVIIFSSYGFVLKDFFPSVLFKEIWHFWGLSGDLPLNWCGWRGREKMHFRNYWSVAYFIGFQRYSIHGEVASFSDY